MRKWISVVALILATGSAAAYAQSEQPSDPQDATDQEAASEPSAVDESDGEAPQTQRDARPATDAPASAPSDEGAPSRTRPELERPADRSTGSTPSSSRSTSAPSTTGRSADAPSDTADAQPARSASQEANYDSWRAITQAELAAPTENYPFVEWHGYFRFRTDSFWNLDLATGGTSPIAPPIEALIDADTNSGRFASYETNIELDDGTTVNLGEFQKEGANFLSTANIRLRLRPIFHVTERASIHVEMDVLDNLVLGSTPYQEGGIAFFSDGQQSPTADRFARDAIRVNQAYGKISAFFGSLQVGRMTNDWGLGIMFNGGGSWSEVQRSRTSYRGVALSGHDCLDCDEGDYVDRAMLKLNLFNHYFMLAYDFNLSGPTWGGNSQAFGQARDIGQFDDSRSFVFAAYSRPETAEELGERNRRLRELRKPSVDYGAYFMFKQQKASSEYCPANIGNPFESVDSDSQCIVPRGANAFIPDLWLRLQYEPQFRRRIRLEFEAAAVIGEIDFPDANFLDDSDPKKLRQFGGAMEFEYQDFALATGFNAGFATGRDLSEESDAGWGIQDGADVLQDRNFNAFVFDDNYFVDMLMFREIVGGISNAVYLNPFFKYDLYAKQNDVLGVRIDLISAFAMQSEATPSGKSFYGVEANLGAYYRQPRYGVDLTTGVFIPGNVFNAEVGRERLPAYRSFTGEDPTFAVDEDASAKAAFTLQTRFFWAF